MLICDVYDRNAPRPLRLAKIYLMTHKYILNLCCVNSFFSRNAHNTRKSPWELSTQCRHFIYTEYTSGVISASCLICSCGINSFMCAVHIGNRPLPMKNTWILFQGGFSLLILKARVAFVETEDGKDTEMPQMFYGFTSSKIASLHIQ